MKKSHDDDSSEGEREDEDNLTDSVGNDSGNEDYNDSAVPSRRSPVVLDPRGKQIRGPLGGRNRGRGGGGKSQDSMRGRGGGGPRHHVVERKTSSDADSYSNEDDGNGDNGGDGDESGGSDDAF